MDLDCIDMGFRRASTGSEDLGAKLEMSTVQQQRLVVDQLRREAGVRRINVSQAIDDIKKFVEEQEQADYLLVGGEKNPWQDKKFNCIIT